MWFAAIFLVLAAPAALALGFSFYVAGVVRRGAFRPTATTPPLDLEILEADESRIRLRARAAGTPELWRQEGVWGLRWKGGHGRLGGIEEDGGDSVVREWTPFGSAPPGGTRARIDRGAFPNDPEAAFGMRFEPVVYSSSRGVFQGSLWRGTGTAWALFVHGKRSANPGPLPHTYPILPVVGALGISCLDAPYQNDEEAPPGDGLHWYGLREWEDLEAAARFALGNGAERLVLFGYSMGGAICLAFMRRSALASRVAGLVLDAPVLDLRAVVEHGIRQRGIPGWLVAPGLWIAAWRIGASWKDFDRLPDALSLTAPVLLVHGDRDGVVPIGGSERLARRRPDLVRFLRAPGAPHAYSWNVGAAGYEAAVRSFLERVLGEGT